MELTALQGEVFTGYYQADTNVYYTEKDWLELQRQLELDRIAEAEYQAEQQRLAKERAERERKRKVLEAQQRKDDASSETGKKAVHTGKKYVFATILVAAIIALGVIFWPENTTTSKTNEPDVVITDTIQEEPLVTIFGNAIITGNDVRMRATPNLQGKIITFFPKEGEGIELLTPAGDSLNWAQVRRENGTTGWVFGDYVKHRSPK